MDSEHQRRPANTRSGRRPSNTSNTGDSGFKRNKTNKACKECRRKKVRCDGETPCERCQRAGIGCVFDSLSASKHPAAPHRRHSSPASQQENNVTTPTPVSSASNNHRLQESHDAISVNPLGRAQYVPDPRGTPTSRMNAVADMHFELKPALINAYFCHIHPFFPILHRPAFEAQLQQQQVPTMLLYAVYAVASHWHNPTNDPVPGWSYYQAAFALMDIGLDAPRVSTIQALVLIIKYHEHVPRPGYLFRTRLYLDVVRRMCLDLKLWRRQNNARERADAEHGVRVFWAVYGLDLSTSIEEGVRPFPLDINDPVEFPSPLSNDGSQQQQDAATLYYFWMCRIWHVQGNIVRFLRIKYDKDLPVTDADEEDETKRRDHLEASLEAIIHNEPLAFQAHGSHPYYAGRFLQLTVHFTTILLCRPYVNSEPIHRTKCLEAALEITHILSEIIYTNGIEYLRHCPPRGIQQCVHYLSASITIFQLIPDSAEAMVKANKMVQILAHASPEKFLWTSNTQEFEDLHHGVVCHVATVNTHQNRYLPPTTMIHSHTPGPVYSRHQPQPIIHQGQMWSSSHPTTTAMYSQQQQSVYDSHDPYASAAVATGYLGDMS